MTTLIWTHFTLLALGLLIQAFTAGTMIRRVKRRPRREQAAFTPRVTVMMAVRGHDPSLEPCLRGLLAQDYPDYHVMAVVDSADDPACRPLAEMQKSCPAGRLETVVISRQRTTCGGKANALIEGVARLQTDTEVMAIIDSDAVPPRNWLRDLVAPLSDPHVGLVTGNRWFEPQPGSFGSAVRSAWNIGALIQMQAADVPWGGCLAFRRSALIENGILRTWERVYSDDVPLRDLTVDAGQTMARVPHLLLVSRETCHTSDLLEWTQRQLLAVWSCMRNRWLLVGTGMYFFALIATLPALVVAALVRFDTTALAWLAADAGASVLGLLLLAVWMERSMSRAILNNGETVRPLGWSLVPAILTAFSIHCCGCVSVVFRRRFNWRGKTYVFHRAHAVNVLLNPNSAAELTLPGESLLH